MSNLKTQNYNLKRKSDLKYRTYRFSLTVIAYINQFPKKQVFWIIGDQLLRSATSVGANIIEAKSSSSKREFIKYYEIALKSANETRYWLNLLKDSRLVGKETIQQLIDEITEISNMLGSSLLTLKGKKKI